MVTPAPDARALWEAVRSGYFPLPYRYGMAYQGVGDSGVVKAPDLGMVNEERLQAIGYSIGAALRLADSARIADSGYAVPYNVAPRKRGLFNRPERRWKYPNLGSYMAAHFIDRAFGLAHTLHVLERNGSEVLLAFCPKVPDRPSIAGTLLVSSDTTLASASWHFRTPAPSRSRHSRQVGRRRSIAPHCRCGHRTPWLPGGRGLGDVHEGT